MNQKLSYDLPMLLFAGMRIVIGRFVHVASIFKTRVLCAMWGIEYKRGLIFEGPIIISSRKKGQIKIERGCVFNARVSGNLAGMSRPTILDAHYSGSKIEIGEMSGFSSVTLSVRKNIRIGKRCKIGADTRIYDHDFHSLDPVVRASSQDQETIRSKEVVIGNDVFIGAQSIILKGTKIGDRSIIAAGSVIFGLDVPADSLVRGNPAQIYKKA